MSNRIYAHNADRAIRMRIRTASVISVISLLGAVLVPRAQSQVSQTQIITIRLNPDVIGVVKTAEKLSTRISFREPIKEIICGDLFDPSSGTGAFVIQRIDSDIFIKPVAPKGVSNMFVKAGEKGERIYNFSLNIVPIEQAYLIVNVVNGLEISASARDPLKESAPSTRPPRIGSIGLTNRELDSAIPRLPWLTGNVPSIPRLGEPPPPDSNTTPNVAPATLTGSRAIIQGQAIKRVDPPYPDFAKRYGLKGSVDVEVIVDQSGKVITARALSGPAMLREAAVSAAQLWRFRPTLMNGKPVEAVGTIKFNFERP